FLQFAAEEVIGNYSFPFQVQNTPKNVRLLQYAGIINKVINNPGIDANCYANGLQHSVGKVKIEKPSHNLNRMQAGTTSAYYLIGASSFHQEVKDKKLRDINVGGNRTFA